MKVCYHEQDGTAVLSCSCSSTYFGQPFCPSSGVLSRTSASVHFMQLWWPFAIMSRMELQFHPAPGSKRSSNLHKMYQSRCTAKNSWWWAERLSETCRLVITIKMEYSESVGLIHNEFFSSTKCPDWLWEPTSLCSTDTRVLSLCLHGMYQTQHFPLVLYKIQSFQCEI